MEKAEMQKKYPKGTRIELVEMKDSHAVEKGTKGTVDFIDDIGTLHIVWDNGRTFGLIVERDKFKILKENEINNEHDGYVYSTEQGQHICRVSFKKLEY